ncbi:M23 family metallopeptidase [Nocardioides sp. HDW12B]|uniref:murein hydrolase activator EnvC family protein n=1 Tax=Nocardioides sp. HDW12B TaxID=2714939 RepID=UPI00140C5BB9|nr:M23 family metallopeptidase [Nocardioides sp. HDW12B]QIK66976.1 M23 family metallopeptidase [Nocardioides sp. HDW12B]
MPLPSLLLGVLPSAPLALGTALAPVAGLVLSGLLVGSTPETGTATAARSPADGIAARSGSTVPRDPAPARGTWPLAPVPSIARPFDPPEQRWSAGHRGADLVGRPGQPVRTALAGTVSYVGRIAGRGIVTVDHGRVRTTYQPVAAVVRRGDEVAEGQVIGRLLLAGSHCAPVACLHWGLIRGDTYLDPLTLVGAVPQPVRLYPW